MDEELNSTSSIPQPPIKEKTLDIVGLQMFGESFTGFMKIGDIQDLVKAFKDFYYEKKIVDPQRSNTSILKEFNTVIKKDGKKLHPYPNQSRQWFRKWEKDIAEKKTGEKMSVEDTQRKEIKELSKMQDNDALLVPDENELEKGVRTLGGELLSDALRMLKADQAFEEALDDDMVIKRRNYVVNVFSHVTKMVHGKAALMLKASEEKRNSTGFLMELMRKATSGNLTEAELELLGTNYKTPEVELSKAHE